MVGEGRGAEAVAASAGPYSPLQGPSGRRQSAAHPTSALVRQGLCSSQRCPSSAVSGATQAGCAEWARQQAAPTLVRQVVHHQQGPGVQHLAVVAVVRLEWSAGNTTEGHEWTMEFRARQLQSLWPWP